MANEKKYGTGGRKQFVRTRVPAAESIASADHPAAARGHWRWRLFTRAKVFDPNLYAVRTDSLKSTAAPVSGQVRHRPCGTRQAGCGADGRTQQPQPAAESTRPPPAKMREGWRVKVAPRRRAQTGAKKRTAGNFAAWHASPCRDTEFYNADNLFEKIDGRAPAYQNYNVQQLRCRSFAVTARRAAMWMFMNIV